MGSLEDRYAREASLLLDLVVMEQRKMVRLLGGAQLTDIIAMSFMCRLNSAKRD
jgi:hypothetical protein